jgi:deoxyribodipyrimidine photolyase
MFENSLGQTRAEDVTKWKQGKTGIPIIDAAMRQVLVFPNILG